MKKWKIASGQENSREMFRRLTEFLEEKERKELHICLIIFLISPVVDLFSVSIMIPVLRGTAKQGASETQMLQIIGLGIIFLLAGLFELAKVKISNSFLQDSENAWSVKMYELYNKEELLEHSKKTPMQQVAGIRTDTAVCANMMVTFMNIVVHTVILVGYLFLSGYVAHWSGVLVSFLLLLFIFFLFFRQRSQILQCGKEKRKGEIKTAALITTAYGAYKEVKIDTRSKHLLHKYEEACAEYAQVQKDYAFLTVRPRILLQNVGCAVIFFILPFILGMGIDLTVFLADLVAGMTILINMLSKAATLVAELNQIQYGWKNYDVFCENMERYQRQKLKEKVMDEVRKKQVTFSKGLRIENLTFHYPGGENILENASLEIPAGHSTAIIGSSGIGKTTFLDLVLGLLTPQTGHIWYDDYEIVEGRDGDGPCRGELGSIVSYIPQVVYLNGETVRNNVVFLEDGEGEEERIISCLKKVQIWEDVKKLPEGIDTLIGDNGTAISGGQRQRIALARAIYKEFKLLIMDEATAALDGETEKAVMDEINHLGESKTLLIVTHHLALAEGCERIYKIEGKKFVKIR